MLLPLFMLLAAASTQTAAPQARPDKMPLVDPVKNDDRCPPISRYEAARRGGKLKPNFLDESPAADLYNAVYRRIDGCVAPVIVRFGVGRR